MKEPFETRFSKRFAQVFYGGGGGGNNPYQPDGPYPLSPQNYPTSPQQYPLSPQPFPSSPPQGQILGVQPGYSYNFSPRNSQAQGPFPTAPGGHDGGGSAPAGGANVSPQGGYPLSPQPYPMSPQNYPLSPQGYPGGGWDWGPGAAAMGKG